MSGFSRLWQWILSHVRHTPHRAHHLKVGEWGEGCAAKFLKRQGFSIVGRNVRPNRHDELDIVAREGRYLVFVEVKTRKRGSPGRPSEAVGRTKQRSLLRGAASFLKQAHYPDLVYRFDIVEVVGAPEDALAPEITLLRNAFPFPKSHHYRP